MCVLLIRTPHVLAGKHGYSLGKMVSSSSIHQQDANLGCGDAHFNFKRITRVEPRDNVSCKQLNTVHYL